MASLLFGKGTNRLQHITDRLYHTEIGCILVSALFGVAFACMFEKVCKGDECYSIKSPPHKELDKYIYQVDEHTCYKYTPKVVACLEKLEQ